MCIDHKTLPTPFNFSILFICLCYVYTLYKLEFVGVKAQKSNLQCEFKILEGTKNDKTMKG